MTRSASSIRIKNNPSVKIAAEAIEFALKEICNRSRTRFKCQTSLCSFLLCILHNANATKCYGIFNAISNCYLSPPCVVPRRDSWLQTICYSLKDSSAIIFMAV